MQNEKIPVIPTHSVDRPPKSLISGLTSTPSESFLHEWRKIVELASEFWERCEEVYTDDECYLFRSFNGEAFSWLDPVLEDLAWIKVVTPELRHPKPGRILDFQYKFVGKNLSCFNGRKFHGDRILDRANRVSNTYGSGGLQSHLFIVLSEAATTGQPKFLYTQYVNCNHEICDIHFAPMPVAMDSDRVTDFFCPMLIRPATVN